VSAMVLIGLGLAFLAVGTLGILRFRDVYSRLQASGVSDNAGLALLLVGLIVRQGWERADATLLLLLLLLLMTNPIVTHSIARSAFVRGHPGEKEAP
jgi:multicomponent Na+:H+ antiporter subunit G